jgi:hypothetical protein
MPFVPCGAPVPGPRFLGVIAGITALAAKGYPLCAVTTAFVMGFLH